MADSAEFTVTLVDKISGPANKAANAIFKINARVSSLIALYRAVNYARTGGLQKDLETLSKATKETVVSVAGKLAIGGAAAATYAIALTKGVVSMGVYADASRRSLAALTGSVGDGEAAFSSATNLAKELGLGVEETVDSFKQLLAMQFKVGEAGELIKITADLRAVTGHAEAAQRAIVAITQIKAKGRLQSEELVGQLAEAGVSTVLVYKELGKILGKDEDAVRKMISAGEVGADTGILAIKRAIQTKLHEKAPGDAAKAFATSTLSGLMANLGAAPGRFFLRVADAAKASLTKLAPIIREITQALDTIDPAPIAEFVGHVLNFAKGAVLFAKEFVLAFMKGTKQINEQLTMQNAGQNAIKLAKELGALLAEAAGMAIWLVGKIASVFVYLNDHRWIVYWGVGLYLAYQVLSVVMMITHALAIMGAAIWIWRTFRLGRLVMYALRMIWVFSRWLFGINLIKQGLLWIGRILLTELVLVPIMIAAWIVAIVAIFVLVFMYWDEICASVKKGVDEMVGQFTHLWDTFVAFLKVLGSGEIWTEAGKAAGKAFVDAFWGALRDYLVAPILGAMGMSEAGQHNILGTKLDQSNVGRALRGESAGGAPVVAEVDPELHKYFASDDEYRASNALAAAPADAEVERQAKMDAILARYDAQMKAGAGLKIDQVNVHVQSPSGDPQEHGKVAAAAFDKDVRAHWAALNSEFGGA